MFHRTNMEIVNENFRPEYVKNQCIIVLETGLKILMRQNTYKKIDALYLTFVRNLIFHLENLLEEIFNFSTFKINDIDIERICESIFQSHFKTRFLIDNVVE